MISLRLVGNLFYYASTSALFFLGHCNHNVIWASAVLYPFQVTLDGFVKDGEEAGSEGATENEHCGDKDDYEGDTEGNTDGEASSLALNAPWDSMEQAEREKYLDPRTLSWSREWEQIGRQAQLNSSQK